MADRRDIKQDPRHTSQESRNAANKVSFFLPAVEDIRPEQLQFVAESKHTLASRVREPPEKQKGRRIGHTSSVLVGPSRFPVLALTRLYPLLGSRSYAYLKTPLGKG